MTYQATIVQKDGTAKTVTAPDRVHRFHCDRCGLDKEHVSDLTTGYGETEDGEIHCFECCGLDDIDRMKETGKIALYLTLKNDPIVDFRGISHNYWTPEKLTNWPGSLKFRLLSWSKGRHNWGIDRYDLWFKGPDGRVWYGRQQGDTQLTDCRRTKHTGYAGVVANYHRLVLDSKEQSI